MRAQPIDWLKATFILLAGVVITAVPFVPLRAATPYYKGAAGKNAGQSYTVQDSDNGTGSDRDTTASRNAIAFSFTPGQSYTLTKIDVVMRRTGSPGGNVVAQIWDDSTGPNALVGTVATSVTTASIGTSNATVTFAGTLSASVTAVRHWLVYDMSSGTHDASNYMSFDRNSFDAVEDTYVSADGGSSWSKVNDEAGNFTTYSTP